MNFEATTGVKSGEQNVQLLLHGVSQYIVRAGGHDTHFILEADAQRYAMRHHDLIRPLQVQHIARP